MWMNKRSSACFSFKYIFISSQAEFWTHRQCTTYSINVSEHMVWITRNVTELSSRDTMCRTWTCECGYKWLLCSKHINVCKHVSVVFPPIQPWMNVAGGVINPRSLVQVSVAAIKTGKAGAALMNNTDGGWDDRWCQQLLRTVIWRCNSFLFIVCFDFVSCTCLWSETQPLCHQVTVLNPCLLTILHIICFMHECCIQFNVPRWCR